MSDYPYVFIAMHLIFVHGWSVTNTDTYGSLPQILAAKAGASGLSLNLIDIHLGRYISFRNEVRMDDVCRAFDQAVREKLDDGAGGIKPFSCITHSTGAPVVRCWMERYYGASRLAQCPLAHLVMLAPANHGSALAILGSGRLGRIKAWWGDIEPGEGILEWLELGSTGGLALNRAWLDYPAPPVGGFRPFVLIGETIDKKLYDHLNSYTGEVGSDGVVRVAAANLAHGWLSLHQGGKRVRMAGGGEATLFQFIGQLRSAKPCPFLVVPKASHSGEDIGIMRSPTPKNADTKPVVAAIIEALAVTTKAEYEAVYQAWGKATDNEQSGKGRRRRFFQIVFQINDDQGQRVTDYDVLLLAGPGYDPDKLPKGFFVDKQVNKHSPERITFYLDYDAMMAVPDGQFGFRVTARPDKGFAFYLPAEFRSNARSLDEFVDPNSTLYVDIVLRRLVDRETVRFDPAVDGPRDFTHAEPAGPLVP